MGQTTDLRRSLVTACLALACLLANALPAWSHAEMEPEAAAADTEVRLLIRSAPERQPFINKRITAIVPREFAAISCDAPLGWSCGFDRSTWAPHTLVAWDSGGNHRRGDIEFGVTVRTPEFGGQWLFRVIQHHADDYAEPWVYETEPFIAPRLVVGGDGTLRNGDRTSEDPRCYGHSQQPSSYREHDGTAVEEGCDRSAPHPAPSPRPSPTPTATPSPTSSPSSSPSPSPTPRPGPTPSPSPRPTPSTSPTTESTASPRPSATPSPSPSPSASARPTPSAAASEDGSAPPPSATPSASPTNASDQPSEDGPSPTTAATDAPASDPVGDTASPAVEAAPAGPGEPVEDIDTTVQVDRDEDLQPAAADTGDRTGMVAALAGVALLGIGIARRRRR